MLKSLKSLTGVLSILLFLLAATEGQVRASEPVSLETETRIAPGHQYPMPCAVPEMALMCPAMGDGTSAADDTGDHAAHHPANGMGDSGLRDLLTQLVTQIEAILKTLNDSGTQ